MIITLSGVTGCGKSHFKNYLVNKFNFENMIIHTTRNPRVGEKDGVDKFFVSKDQFRKMQQNGEFFASYKFLGEYYGYSKRYLSKNINSVTELHYEWIEDFKKNAMEICSIYIFPIKLELAKKALKERKFEKIEEIKRLKEIDEHIYNINNDKKLLSNFKYRIYNDYTEKTNMKIDDILKGRT